MTTIPLSKEQIEAIQAWAKKAMNSDCIDITKNHVPALCQQALRAIELEAEVKEFQRDKRDLLEIVSAKNDKLAALQTELTAARNALEEERERCAKVCDRLAQNIADERYRSASVEAIARAREGAVCAAAERIRALPSPEVKP